MKIYIRDFFWAAAVVALAVVCIGNYASERQSKRKPISVSERVEKAGGRGLHLNPPADGQDSRPDSRPDGAWNQQQGIQPQAAKFTYDVRSKSLVLYRVSSAKHYVDESSFETAENGEIECVAVSNAVLEGSALAMISELRTLKQLKLEDTNLDDLHLGFILLPLECEILNISGTYVTDRCIPTLVSEAQLKELNVSNTAITAGGLARLREQRPDLVIIEMQ
jgi:hypothetical protein